MKIQLACHPNSFGRYGPQAALEHLAELGIPSVELPIKTAGVASPFGEEPLLTNASSPDDLQRVSRAIRRAGLQICSCNITSGNPLQTGAFEATLTKLRMAADLGVRLVVAGGGEFGSPDEEQVLIGNLLRIGQACQDLGLIYCCETHPGVCQNADSMLRLMSQLEHPQIRINFDTANILYYNQGLDVCNELLRVVKYVKHVHLKDSRGTFQEWHFPALGEGGAVDFSRVGEILASAGYDGPLSLEVEGIQSEPQMTLDQYLQRVTRSVTFLNSLGFEGDS